MNILTLTSSYPRFKGDPTAPFIESITRHVAARGHTVHLVLPEHRAWNRPRVEDGVHFHPYRYSPRKSWTPWGYSEALEAGTRIKRRLYPLASAVVASALRTSARVVSRESIDVVHAHWLVPNGPIGSLVAKPHELPLVIACTARTSPSPTSGRWQARRSPKPRPTRPVDRAEQELADRDESRTVNSTGSRTAPTRRSPPDAADRHVGARKLGPRPGRVAVLGIGGSFMRRGSTISSRRSR